MSLTKEQLVSEIASQMVRTDLDTRIAIWLNWGLTRIDRFSDLKGLGKHAKAACVVGQTEYAFPTDCKYIRTFSLLDHIVTTLATTDVSVATDVLTVDESITTGTRLIFLNSDPPGGLVQGTDYYCIKVTSTTIQVASTSALATAGTAITLTDVGSGTHVLEIFSSNKSRVLEYLPEKEFMTNVPDATETAEGMAGCYIDRDDIFELSVPPNARYTIDLRYVKWQDDMADLGSSEVSKIDDIIVAATIVEGWHALNEFTMRDSANQYFMSLLGSHRTVDKLRPDYSPKAKAFGSEGVRFSNMQSEAYKYPFISGRF